MVNQKAAHALKASCQSFNATCALCTSCRFIICGFGIKAESEQLFGCVGVYLNQTIVYAGNALLQHG
jgi:hypothetical protein